jgi:hypothetical protein
LGRRLTVARLNRQESISRRRKRRTKKQADRDRRY